MKLSTVLGSTIVLVTIATLTSLYVLSSDDETSTEVSIDQNAAVFNEHGSVADIGARQDSTPEAGGSNSLDEEGIEELALLYAESDTSDAEYIRALASAQERLTRGRLVPSPNEPRLDRLRVVEIDKQAVSSFFTAAQSGQDSKFDLSLFPDSPCTIQSFQYVAQISDTAQIRAQCIEEQDFRITAWKSTTDSTFAITLRRNKIEQTMLALDERFAVVYEFQYP